MTPRDRYDERMYEIAAQYRQRVGEIDDGWRERTYATRRSIAETILELEALDRRLVLTHRSIVLSVVGILGWADWIIASGANLFDIALAGGIVSTVAVILSLACLLAALMTRARPLPDDWEDRDWSRIVADALKQTPTPDWEAKALAEAQRILNQERR